MKKVDKNAKPNKVKIELAFDRCKDSVQELLDQYQSTIDGYLAKMVALKKEGRLVEADRYKQKLKLVLGRQAKMNELMDQVEQFSYMIDEAFAKVEEMYQNYMIAKSSLTYEEQQAEEKNIIANEQKITTYQENVFGNGGVLTKKQEEMLKPFHEKVAKSISDYAASHGYDMVIDIATTALPYYSPKIDITEEIIKLVK